MTAPAIAGVPRSAIRTMIEREHERFAFANPRSRELAARSARHWLHGVPMHWMLDWPTPFPLSVAAAKGATFTDADGHGYADFCLGDTGAMFGHAPEPVAEAVRRQTARGLTTMLPSEDAADRRRAAGQALRPAVLADGGHRDRRQPLRRSAGRAASPAGRRSSSSTAAITAPSTRPSCALKNGKPINRPGLSARSATSPSTPSVVEFNDSPRSKRRWRAGDVACVITEPVLTNCGMVLPRAGLPRRRCARLTRKHGTLLLIDETHTISTGPGGYTRALDLAPDFFVLGKPIAGGIPCAVFGMTAEVAERLIEAVARRRAGLQRHRHDAVGQSAAARGHARRARTGHDAGRLRPMLGLSARLARSGIGRAHRRSRAALARRARGRARRVRLRARPPRNGTEARPPPCTTSSSTRSTSSAQPRRR